MLFLHALAYYGSDEPPGGKPLFDGRHEALACAGVLRDKDLEKSWILVSSSRYRAGNQKTRNLEMGNRLGVSGSRF